MSFKYSLFAISTFAVLATTIYGVDTGKKWLTIDTPKQYFYEETIFYQTESITEKKPIPIKKSPSFVQVISGKELSRLGVQNITEALNLFGVISASNAGGNRSLFMQGFGSGQTKFLIDGVDLKDPIGVNGAPYFNGLTLSDIDRIEIVSGAKGTLYGSQAIAGVVHIITKKGTGGDVSIAGGSGYMKTAARYGTQLDKLTLSISGEKTRNTQISRLSNTNEIDPSDLENIAIYANYKLDTTTFNLAYRRHQLTESLDSSFGGIDDPNFTTHSTQDLISAGAEVTLTEKIKSSLALTRTELDRHTVNLVDSVDPTNSENTHYAGTIDKIDWRTRIDFDDSKALDIGLDTETESGSYVDTRTSAFGPFTSRLSETSQNSTGIYTQGKWENNILNISAGGRYESYFAKNLSAYNVTVYRPLYVIPLQIGYSYKQGFRKPVLYERFNTAIGTKDLNAETSVTNEISLFQNWDEWSFKAAYFQSKIDNLITTTAQFSNTAPLYSNTFINSSETMESKGFNTQVTYVPTEGLIDFVRVSYTQTNSKNGTANALKIPEYKWVNSLGLDFTPILVGISHVSTGKQYATGTTSLPAYNVVNANLSYALSKSSTLSFTLHNALNTQYEAVQSFAAPGREYTVGYTLTF